MHGIRASSCHVGDSFIVAVTKPGDLSPRAAAEELRPPAGCTPSPPGPSRTRNGLDQQRRIPAAAPASSPQAAGPPEGHGGEAGRPHRGPLTPLPQPRWPAAHLIALHGGGEPRPTASGRARNGSGRASGLA